MTRGPKNTQAGFTLIEVLISLFIFALIMVGTMTALTQSLRGKARLETSLNDLNAINSARAIIRSDIDAIVFRPLRDELGGQLLYSLTTDGDPLLSFTRAGLQNPGGLEIRGDLERVEYHFENGNLIRRSFDHVNPSSNGNEYDRVLIDSLTAAQVTGLIYRRGTFATADFLRVQNGDAQGLDGAAIVITLTDEFDEVSEHIFEVGS